MESTWDHQLAASNKIFSDYRVPGIALNFRYAHTCT